MTLNEYTEAAQATAEPRAYDLEYLLPGLIGEVGEFFAEFAKQHWHETDRSDTIVDEYGDVAWITAILLSNYGIGDDELEHLVKRYGRDVGLERDEAMELLLGRASAVYLSDEVNRPMRAAMLWSTLVEQSSAIAGASFEDVLRRNTEKLAERSGKGELKTHE